MPTAVVTGANSGIGNAFAKLLIKEGYDVVGLDRDDGDQIKSLGCKYMQVDVSRPGSITSFKQQFFNGDQPVDLLLNIAGVASPFEQDTLETVSLDVLTKIFSVNAFGPLLLTQALLPNILKSQAKPPRIAVMSSRVGSIADNASGGAYAYRASKTAVNSVFKNIALDVKSKGVVVTIMHPGIVKTNIMPGSEIPPEAVEPDEAATKLWKVLQEKGTQIENTAKFWHREGTAIQW